MNEIIASVRCECGHQWTQTFSCFNGIIQLQFVNCPVCDTVYIYQGKIETKIYLAHTKILPLEDDLRRNGNSTPVPAEGV